ncbi:ComEC/Rec2 family competence protein [Flindersiella endophytica]
MVAVVMFGIAAGMVVCGLQVAASRAGPLPSLAADGAVVTADLRVRSDPLLRQGRPPRRSTYVVVHADVERVRARGITTKVATAVIITGPELWKEVVVGQRIRAVGRLASTDPAEREAAMFSARSPPWSLAEPGPLDRLAEHLRAGLRAAVARLPPDERGLVPALVVGDTSNMPEALTDDFRTAGLSHLTAVSGTNLTILLGFVLGAARRTGVRSWGLPLLGLVCVAGFVLLARPDPSVLRAAAMGLVGLVGTAFGSRRHGIPALAIAVIVLLLNDPWLGRSYGFALSVCATAGIVLFTRPWTDAIGRWLPRWLGMAIAVPLAAQLACTPLIAVLSGAVSVVGVVANLLAGYAVVPATVLGILATLVGGVSTAAAAVPAWPAGLAARWIVEVATHAARVPGASLTWPVSVFGVVLLTAACLVAVLVARRVLARRALTLALAAMLVLWLVQPFPGRLTPQWLSGWPPAGWVIVACDVGQGDALVLNAGPGAGVVVDTGPDPALVDRCLTDLGIKEVPFVLLTHFHADHVDGLPGVLRGRSVGEISTRPFQAPKYALARTRAAAAAAKVPLVVAAVGERGRAGAVSWTALAPSAQVSSDPAELAGEGSAENDASVVITAEVHGVRILLTGDVELAAQRALLASGADLHADVLKVPHHGSKYQDPRLLSGTGARLALVSVGADNDYGHPAPSTIRLLEAAGATVLRTDLAGDIAVARTKDGLGVASRRRAAVGVARR